jgi:hypothetical protein
MLPRHAGTIVLLAGAMALAGCSREPDEKKWPVDEGPGFNGDVPDDGIEQLAAADANRMAAQEAEKARKGSGVRLVLLEPSSDMLLAALEGVLHTEGPCLYIVGDNKREGRSLPAFHIPDIRWDPGTQTLRVGSVVYSNGQRVVLGGGYPPTLNGLKRVQRRDPSCDASQLFVTGSIEAAKGR